MKYPTSRIDGPVSNYGKSGTASGAVAGGAVANNQVFTINENDEIVLETIIVTPDDVCASQCK